jgi:hypothetical protein
MLRPVKRVPIPVVIVLSLAALGLTWWQGTRHMDFLTPPSETVLARTRARAAVVQHEKSRLFSIGRELKEKAAIESPIRAAPAIDPGDPASPAPLNAYAEHAAEGPSAYITLAVHLEEQGGNARALLAWERVIDSCRPDDPQRQAAMSGIQRLRPVVAPWNIDPVAAKPLPWRRSLRNAPTSWGVIRPGFSASSPASNDRSARVPKPRCSRCN